MIDLVVHGDVAEELKRISEQEQRPVEAVLRSLLDQYNVVTDSDVDSDPLDAFIGMIDDDITDLSSTVRETMEDYYRKKYGDSR